jgi:drug/metabolite transporter (DMT)-like permease
MHIVSAVKFAIGIVFLLIGAVMLVRARGTRGFNQSRQAGALFLIGGVLFLAIGLGWLDIKGLFG